MIWSPPPAGRWARGNRGAGQVGLARGLKAFGVAVVTVVAVPVVATRYGGMISRFISVRDPEALLLSVLGLTSLVGRVAAELKVSAAVGIAISVPVAHHATEMLSLPWDLFAAVFFGLSTGPRDIPGGAAHSPWPGRSHHADQGGDRCLAGQRVGIAPPGRLRADLALMPRGEFSIVIAERAVTSGVHPRSAPLATAYVLITVVSGRLLHRRPDYAWFTTLVRRHLAAQRALP